VQRNQSRTILKRKGLKIAAHGCKSSFPHIETLDFILSFNDYKSLIKAIAEKKIEMLFYQGIDGIQKFFKERIGVKLFKEKYEQINLLVKQRNLAVHKRQNFKRFYSTVP
jgi:hypothetical protein